MKLRARVDFHVNKNDGEALDWSAEPYRLDKGAWVHIKNNKNGETICELELNELKRLVKAIDIANDAEINSEKITVKSEGA